MIGTQRKGPSFEPVLGLYLLKKIASLALAGIMAVSMLAGCKDGTNQEEPGSSSSEVTTVSGAAEGLNSALLQNNDVIKFENDAELDRDLEAYFSANPINGDHWKLSTTVEWAADNTKLANYIGVTHTDYANFKGLVEYKTDSTNFLEARAVVGMFNSKVFTKADALKYVGNAIDNMEFATDATDKNDGKEFVYSGKASVI